jgi:hypothetical protein
MLVFGALTRPSEAAEWIIEKGVRILNVAGNREGEARGIGERVEAFMTRVFHHLGHRAEG